MADSLNASLQRSLVLGLQVLERASKRKVDWALIRGTDRRLRPADNDHRKETPREQSSAEELRAAFSSISGFMIQTSTHCQRYHSSLSSLSDPEQSHVCRFHCCSSPRRNAQSHEEDFHVEVSPGTYSVTAYDPRSSQQRAPLASPRQQTQEVSLGEGESAVLTFHL